MEIRSIFVNNLKRLMLANGKSQLDLSDDLNIKQQTISTWMVGKAYPRAEALQKLADYFDVSITDLVGEDKGGLTPGVVRVNVYSALGASRDNMDVIGVVEVASRHARNGELIALKIKGDANAPKIDNGDIVIIRLGEVANSDMVVVQVGSDDAIVRRYTHNEFGITLYPLNPNHEPSFFSHHEVRKLPVVVLGKIIESRRVF